MGIGNLHSTSTSMSSSTSTTEHGSVGINTEGGRSFGGVLTWWRDCVGGEGVDCEGAIKEEKLLLLLQPDDENKVEARKGDFSQT